MNEVSIIINGVRYDAVETKELYSCEGCDLTEMCSKPLIGFCTDWFLHNIVFKKSDKKFEP